jgi:long-chain acyl-CoA synthetase
MPDHTPARNRPWLASYDSGVPATLAPYPDETLVDLVRQRGRERPDAPALRFEGAVTSYGTLLTAAEAFGRALEHRGVRPGDRVALVLPNCPQFVIAELGAWMIGAIVAPVNPTYPDEDLAGLLSRAGAQTVVALAPFYERVKSVQSRTAVSHVIVAYVRDALPWAKAWVFRLTREHKDGHGTRPRDEDVAWRDVLAAHRGERPMASRPRASDPAILLPSGGTTGTPKWVVGCHGGLVMAGRQLNAWLASVLTPWRDTLLVPLPLFHVYGAAGVQALAFTGGLSLALVPNPRDTRGLLATIRRERPAFLCAVPTLLTGLMSHPDAEKTRTAFRAIKLCFSGAAPLLAETRRRFEELTGGVVMEGYSLTEAQMATIANPASGPKKTGSIGMPLPDVDLRLVDVETGTREAAPGEQGELLLNAPQLMHGYWDRPEETAEVLRSDDDGVVWLHTGDIGFMDADGYLFLTDRKKELIKVSGFQVWPREIEEVLAMHPAVLEAGVAPVVHGVKGELPKAWVVLRAGATASPREIREFCKERLVAYKVPVEVVLVTDLPKSAVGKVLRRKLRDLDAPSGPRA